MNEVNGGDNAFVRCVSVCLFVCLCVCSGRSWELNANSSKTVKATDLKFDKVFQGRVRTWPPNFFQKGAWPESRDPLNFSALNANAWRRYALSWAPSSYIIVSKVCQFQVTAQKLVAVCVFVYSKNRQWVANSWSDDNRSIEVRRVVFRASVLGRMCFNPLPHGDANRHTIFKRKK